MEHTVLDARTAAHNWLHGERLDAADGPGVGRKILHPPTADGRESPSLCFSALCLGELIYCLAS